MNKKKNNKKKGGKPIEYLPYNVQARLLEEKRIRNLQQQIRKQWLESPEQKLIQQILQKLNNNQNVGVLYGGFSKQYGGYYNYLKAVFQSQRYITFGTSYTTDKRKFLQTFLMDKGLVLLAKLMTTIVTSINVRNKANVYNKFVPIFDNYLQNMFREKFKYTKTKSINFLPDIKYITPGTCFFIQLVNKSEEIFYSYNNANKSRTILCTPRTNKIMNSLKQNEILNMFTLEQLQIIFNNLNFSPLTPKLPEKYFVEQVHQNFILKVVESLRYNQFMGILYGSYGSFTFQTNPGAFYNLLPFNLKGISINKSLVALANLLSVTLELVNSSELYQNAVKYFNSYLYYLTNTNIKMNFLPLVWYFQIGTCVQIIKTGNVEDIKITTPTEPNTICYKLNVFTRKDYVEMITMFKYFFDFLGTIQNGNLLLDKIFEGYIYESVKHYNKSRPF
jgi:hypothetical protein